MEQSYVNVVKNTIHDLVIDIESLHEEKAELEKQVKSIELKIRVSNTKIYNTIHEL